MRLWLMIFLLMPTAVAQSAQPETPLCIPTLSNNISVASPAQRQAAGAKAVPPLTDTDDGFAWPDTPIGVVRSGSNYMFFGSDGGLHSAQTFQSKRYGNGKYGSATRTVGTLTNALGSSAPANVTIQPNADPSINPNYKSYDYIGGGPVFTVPAGQTGAGNLLMVYHAEIPTPATGSFYSLLGLARSIDQGQSWSDLGEIVRINQAYRIDLDGFDIGDPPLVLVPSGANLLIYFRDWLANGTTHGNNTVTNASVARAPLGPMLDAAFGQKPRAVPFQKYYNGSWDLEPGLGGYSTDLNPNAAYSGELQVAYNEALQRYMMIIDEGVLLAYAESANGLTWSSTTLLYDFRTAKGQPRTYASPIGEGVNPSLLDKEFYIYYTRYPNNGEGWSGASLNRFTATCQ